MTGTRRPEKDPRDVVLDAARRWAAVEGEVRELTRKMRAAPCGEKPPCWAGDDRCTWADPKQPIPDSYCFACVANTERARLRHAVKRRAARYRRVLMQAALALERSLWAEAVPLVAKRKRAPAGRRSGRGRRGAPARQAPASLELFDGDRP